MKNSNIKKLESSLGNPPSISLSFHLDYLFTMDKIIEIKTLQYFTLNSQ